MVQNLLTESLDNAGRLDVLGRGVVGVRADYALLSHVREFQADYPRPGRARDPRASAGAAGAAAAARLRSPRPRPRPSCRPTTPRCRRSSRAFDDAFGQAAGRLVEWTIEQAAAAATAGTLTRRQRHGASPSSQGHVALARRSMLSEPIIWSCRYVSARYISSMDRCRRAGGLPKQRGTMDVKTLCLGVLTEGDQTGYEIKHRFEEAFSHFFGASFGSIYPALAELSRQGLVTCRSVEQDKRPDKKVYSLTERGQRALLDELMATPPRHKVRSEFLVLMYFAHLLPPARVAAIIDQMIAHWEPLVAEIERCAAATSATYGADAGHALCGRLRPRRARRRADLCPRAQGRLLPARSARPRPSRWPWQVNEHAAQSLPMRSPAALALALTGWLLSGRLGADDAPTRGRARSRPAAAGKPLPTVRVREVVAAPVSREVVINGKTAPARAVELRAETTGRVIELGARRGAAVARGRAAGRASTRASAGRWSSRRGAALQMREIEHAAAQKLGARAFRPRPRWPKPAPSSRRAQATLERAQLELDRTEIRAPFAGVLERAAGRDRRLRRDRRCGRDRDRAGPVPGHRRRRGGRASGASRSACRAARGWSPARRSTGRVRYVGGEADPATRTFTVELEVANPGGRFAAGVSAELRICPRARRSPIEVPASLLALDDAGVLGVQDGRRAAGVVRFHPAEVVRADADSVWLGGPARAASADHRGPGLRHVRARRVTAVPEDAPAARGRRGEPLMRTLIDASFARSRAVLLALALILLGGWLVYRDIPKEADPDVQIPIVYVSMTHEGISPEDAERLLVRPMETGAALDRGHQGDALLRQRGPGLGDARVRGRRRHRRGARRRAREGRHRQGRAAARTPTSRWSRRSTSRCSRCWWSRSSGDVPERTLLQLARDLEDRIEGLSNVLEVEIAGDREELLEVIIDPLLIESYGLRHEDLLAVVERNNRLVAAGALDTGQGRFAVKVPGVFETAEDVLDLPMKAEGDRVVRLGDIGDRAADVQGSGRLRPRRRPTGAGARGQEARSAPTSSRRSSRCAAVVERQRQAWPPDGRGRLRPGQVRHHPLDARRPREQRRERGRRWS